MVQIRCKRHSAHNKIVDCHTHSFHYWKFIFYSIYGKYVLSSQKPFGWIRTEYIRSNPTALFWIWFSEFSTRIIVKTIESWTITNKLLYFITLKYTTTIDLYEVFCAISYVDATSLFPELKTTFVIVAAQGVKNTNTAEQKGYDVGKKVSGIKRHIVMDTQGPPHAIHAIRRLVGSDEHVGWWQLYWDIHLPMPYKMFWGLRWRSLGETNCTSLQWLSNDGLSSARLLGLETCWRL